MLKSYCREKFCDLIHSSTDQTLLQELFPAWPVKAALSLGLKSDCPSGLPLSTSGKDPDPTDLKKKQTQPFLVAAS